MKDTTNNPGEIWKQFEDLLVPRLGLSVVDRAAYSHLLRHSRIEGRVRLRFSILWLALGIGLSGNTARDAVRRLINLGALRLLARTKRGHVVEVRLPGEICGIRAPGKEEGWPLAAGLPAGSGELGRLDGDNALPNLDPNNIEATDFMQSRALRKAIHERERGLCFYCLCRLTSTLQCLDHVVPRAQSGSSSYRNLVSCCLECNSRKGEQPAGDFLRWLYREGRLAPEELTGRLRALEALASGQLLPVLVETGGIYPDPVGSPASFPPAICSEQASSGVTAPADSASAPTTTLAEMERMTILRVFEQTNGDKALAGKMLGISRATLYRKLKRYNIAVKADAADIEYQETSQ